MKRILLIFSPLMLGLVLLTGCHKDLDKFPPNSLTSADVYRSEGGYLQVLAKVYGSMALTGNIGPAGGGDVAGIDEGTSDFLRLFWKAQELTTDEAVVAWNDPGIQDFHNMNWSSANPMTKGLYYRCLYTITICNEFIRESADAKLAERNITGTAATSVRRMRAEAQYVRAFQYWVLMDMFGSPTFVTETDGIGTFQPRQASRAEVFDYVTKQLGEVIPQLPEPGANDYGRVDKAAAWALLARVWLNAQVYLDPLPSGLTAQQVFNNAVNNAKLVIESNKYNLFTNYTWLFLADNDQTNRTTREFIWTINYDGINTKNFGGTTFLVNASVGGDMDNTVSGLGGWGGIRTTRNLPLLFPDFTGSIDKRAQFVEGSQTLEINDISSFKDGLAVIKYRNRTRSGAFGRDPERTFSDIDFPVFRLAEMFLIYAEGVARGATTGTSAQARDYINQLRQRSYGSALGNITSADATNLNFILDERARELYWEGHRRSDLIRHNKFVEGTYLWPWKGGVRNGTGVPAFRKLFPIPDSEVASNSNIRQNPGY